MNVFSYLFKSTGFYFLGNVLSKLILFFLLPVYTACIKPEQLGYYDVANTYLNLIITFLFIDIYVGIMRFIFDEKDGCAHSKPIFNGGIIFCLSLSLYSLVALTLWLLFDIQYMGYIYLYGVCLVFNNLLGYLARAFGAGKLFAVSGIVNTVVACSLNVIGLVFLKGGIEVLYIASIAGILVQLAILEHKVRMLRHISVRYYDGKVLKSLFRYSMPLSLNSLAYWFLTGYANIIVADKLGLEANGIYMIAVKFGMAISLLSTCFNQAWQEVAFIKGNDDKQDLGVFYSKAINMLIVFFGVGTIGIIHFSYLIFPYMVSADYAKSLFIIPTYLIVAMLGMVSSFLGQIYAALKATRIIMYSTLAACICNMVLVPVFIPLWGLQGAVLAMVISFLVNVAMRVFVIRGTVRITVDYKRLLWMAGMLAISFFVFYSGQFIGNMCMLLLIFVCSTIMLRKYIRQIVTGLFMGKEVNSDD